MANKNNDNYDYKGFSGSDNKVDDQTLFIEMLKRAVDRLKEQVKGKRTKFLCEFVLARAAHSDCSGESAAMDAKVAWDAIVRVEDV